MKFKVIFIVFVLVCSLLISFKWLGGWMAELPALSASAKSEANVKSQNASPLLLPGKVSTPQQVSENHELTPDQAALKVIIQQGFGNGAAKANEAMEAFLRTSNPIGWTADEVKTVLGNPSVESGNSISYIFDTGAFGWTFLFVLRDGKVAEVKTPLTETK